MLKKNLQMEKEKEFLYMKEKWKEENGQLVTSLSDNLIELESTRVELKRVQAELATSGEGLKLVNNSLDSQRDELAVFHRDLDTARRELEQSVQEKDYLSVCVHDRMTD